MKLTLYIEGVSTPPLYRGSFGGTVGSDFPPNFLLHGVGGRIGDSVGASLRLTTAEGARANLLPPRFPRPLCLQCQIVHLQCQIVHLFFHLLLPLWMVSDRDKPPAQFPKKKACFLGPVKKISRTHDTDKAITQVENEMES